MMCAKRHGNGWMRGVVLLALTLCFSVSATAQIFEKWSEQVGQHTVQLYRHGAELGDADAQFILGMMYNDGRWGATQDYAEAMKWYLKAAEQGYAAAQNRIGLMYSRGHGVAQSYAEAAQWFRKAAEQGVAATQSYTGRQANARGVAIAQANLASMYVEGQGVSQNNATAYMWMILSLARLDPASPSYSRITAERDSLAQQLTQDQIAEAERQARDWEDAHKPAAR
jgi:TPR repeat protein